MGDLVQAEVGEDDDEGVRHIGGVDVAAAKQDGVYDVTLERR